MSTLLRALEKLAAPKTGVQVREASLMLHLHESPLALRCDWEGGERPSRPCSLPDHAKIQDLTSLLSWLCLSIGGIRRIHCGSSKCAGDSPTCLLVCADTSISKVGRVEGLLGKPMTQARHRETAICFCNIHLQLPPHLLPPPPAPCTPVHSPRAAAQS